MDAAHIDVLVRSVHPAWELPPIAPVLRRAVELAEQHGRQLLPEPGDILRVFRMNPLDVQVLIVGQDPYPTPGDAMGLAFASRAVRIPKSLVNIYRELADDEGVVPPGHADLSVWETRGVMLLNRVLTVEVGAAGCHQGIGWEEITEAAVRQVAKNEPFAAVLWGAQAQRLREVIGEERCVCSPHPSPLAAYRGFWGSRPFSRVNRILEGQGGSPVNWTV